MRHAGHDLFRRARRLAIGLTVGLAGLLAAGGARADGSEPNRFLLIFETSPVIKKDLPAIHQILGQLFASNLQKEIQTDDDLAVWTVDQTLHTGTFGMASWSPEEAEVYSENLTSFLEHQKYSRRASLAAVQPLLNRVVKSSERLTVIIFCDSGSRHAGTPYDAGVNGIITNAVTRLKGDSSPFILVLRSYHGEYLGCSVNRQGPLNFPKFPPPPAPKVAPAPAPAVTIAPPPLAAPVTGPVVTPVPALIIVGTNATTNAAAVLKASETVITMAATAAPPIVASAPVVNPPATPAPAAPPPAPAPEPAVPASAPNAPAPAVTTPAAPSAAQKSPAPEPAVTAVTQPTAAPTLPEVSPTHATATADNNPSPDNRMRRGLLAGGGALLAAGVIAVWLGLRGRRSQGSLITRSMQNDPRLPPRK